MWNWVRRRRGRLHGPGEIEDALRRALVAVLDGDFDEAEEWLGRVARSDSEAAGTYLALARLYRRRGELGRALHLHQNLLFRKDLSRDERRLAKRGLADDFCAGGFLRRAEAAYQEVLAENPRDPAALRGLLRILDQSRRPREALPLALRLARLEGGPRQAIVAERWLAVARAEHKAGRTREARKAVQRALRSGGDHAEAWELLGEIEAELGRDRRALSAWRKAADLDREVAERIYPKLAATYAGFGRAREYERFLQHQLEQQPDRAAARLALARALGARGEVQAGLEQLAPLLKDSPASLAAQAARGRLLLQEGDADACRKAYEALLETVEERWLVPPPEFPS